MKQSAASGLAQLRALAQKEYRQDLESILENEPDLSFDQIGRLVGVMLKEPLATAVDTDGSSSRTRAFRAWELREEKVKEARRQGVWQIKVLEQLRAETDDEWLAQADLLTIAQHAQHESGFFGLYARSVGKYICRDEATRKRVEAEFQKIAKTGDALRAPNPETIVGAGALLWTSDLIAAAPLIQFVTAPVLAAMILILYVRGVDWFCTWAAGARTDESEKN